MTWGVRGIPGHRPRCRMGNPRDVWLVTHRPVLTTPDRTGDDAKRPAQLDRKTLTFAQLALTLGTAMTAGNTDTTSGSRHDSWSGDPATKMAWLRGELDRQLMVYRRRRRRDKRKAFVLQMATVTLSATITVLLGVRVTGGAQQTLADAALALGALITVLAASEAFFSHRGLWILRTETVRNLETLRRHIGYYEAGLNGASPESSDVDRYGAELDQILANDHTAWQRLRESTKEGTHDETPSPSQ